MSIDVLGKSLLASAKKKTKKGKMFGNIAAAALIGITGANAIIRKKAMARAQEFNNSLTPIKSKLDGEFKAIGEIETQYNKIGEGDKARLYFIDEQVKILKNVINQSPNASNYNNEDLRKIATSESQDEYDDYMAKVNTYKNYFGIKPDDYYKHFNALQKEGEAEIKNDNLLELLGRGLGFNKDSKIIQAKIALGNEKEMDLALPQRLLDRLDIPFLKQINQIETRKLSANAVETSQKLYIEDGEVDFLISQIIEPTPTKIKEFKIDERYRTAWNEIVSSQTKDKKTNPFYMGTVTFAAQDNEGNEITSVITIKDLQESLSKTSNGVPLDVTSLAENQMSDWGKIQQQTYKILDGKKAKHINESNEPITDELMREWASVSLRQAISANVELTTTEQKGIFKTTTAQVGKLRLVEVPGEDKPKQDIADIFVNQMGDNMSSPAAQTQLLKFINMHPEFTEKLSPYIVNVETGKREDTITERKEEATIDPLTTLPSLLESEEPEETEEVKETPSLLSPSGRLSAEEMNRRMDEGAKRMGEKSISLGELLGMDKESVRNRVTKKAEKYLSGETSSFTSSTFNKWVEETKGIKSDKVRKEDKPELVREFLEFLKEQ